MSDKPTYKLLIASYLEPEHVERIRQIDACVEVIYEPELIAPRATRRTTPAVTGSETRTRRPVGASSSARSTSCSTSTTGTARTCRI